MGQKESHFLHISGILSLEVENALIEGEAT
jgi:hypothetical protein